MTQPPSANHFDDKPSRVNGGLLIPWAILTILLVLVALPRFNRNTRFIDRPPKDDVQYQLYVSFFRGEPVADQLQSASTWRPVVPAVASVLPLRPMSALNTINLFALAGALFFLLALLQLYDATERQLWVGGLLFVVSFPTFYYSTIGYVDPGGIFFVSAGLYLALRGQWLLVILCAAIGVLAKESAFALVPVLAAAMTCRHVRSSRVLLYSLVAVAITIGLSIWIREVAPGVHNGSMWRPTIDVLAANAQRPAAWASAALTLGLPGLLSMRYLFRTGGVNDMDTPDSPANASTLDRRQVANGYNGLLLVLLTGLAATIAMWFAAFTSAYVDGRTLWPATLFLIPIAVLGFRRGRAMIGQAGE